MNADQKMYYNKENYELKHYGMPRRSGRYPYGSGENPYQGEFGKKRYKIEKKKYKIDKKVRKILEKDVARKQAKLTNPENKQINKLDKTEYEFSKYKLEQFVNKMKDEYGHKKVKDLKVKTLKIGENEVIKVIKKLDKKYKNIEKLNKQQDKDSDKYQKLINKSERLDKKLDKLDKKYYKKVSNYY